MCAGLYLCVCVVHVRVCVCVCVRVWVHRAVRGRGLSQLLLLHPPPMPPHTSTSDLGVCNFQVSGFYLPTHSPPPQPPCQLPDLSSITLVSLVGAAMSVCYSGLAVALPLWNHSRQSEQVGMSPALVGMSPVVVDPDQGQPAHLSSAMGA